MAHLLQRSKAAAAAPEKSNFAQTCNLLSQFLKERGSFGNISRGLPANHEADKGPETSRTPATTLNLLPGVEISADNSSRQNSMPSANIKPVDFFPQFVGSASPNTVEDSTNNYKAAAVRKSSPATAQMTILYAGQVMVFNDFPAEKVKEIIDFAGKLGASNTTTTTNGSTSTSAMAANSTVNAPSLNKVREGLQLRPQDNGSDLPIARRASLHRFFEKRKDRVAAKAPYQIPNPSSPPRPRSEERKPVFIDLESECSSSKHLELTL